MQHSTLFLMRFPHSYEVEEYWETSGRAEVLGEYYFPHPLEKRRMDGLSLRVSPNGAKPWIGKFSFGGHPNDWATTVLSCPNANQICVVCSGAGHIVNAREPWISEKLGAFPVVTVKEMPERELIVFSDYTQVVGYGKEGPLWTSGKISWDGIEIGDAYGDDLNLVGWDSPSQKKTYLKLDLRNGKTRTSQPAR
jgi:hypothetical protein